MVKFEDYRNRFKFVRLERRDGILEITLHHNGGPAVWEANEGGIHDEVGEAFYWIGRDRETKVIILTGAGEAFIERMDLGPGPVVITPGFWDRILREGKDLLMNLLEIDVPIIGVVNGNAYIHAELVVLSDIVLAADTARFADKAHAIYGVVPSDGVHVIWPMLLGPNRGRHFLLTGAEIDAKEALRLGFVAEVLPPAKLRERAWTIAAELAAKPALMLRYTRIATTQHIKRRLLDDLGPGLSLEGLAAITTT